MCSFRENNRMRIVEVIQVPIHSLELFIKPNNPCPSRLNLYILWCMVVYIHIDNVGLWFISLKIYSTLEHNIF